MSPIEREKFTACTSAVVVRKRWPSRLGNFLSQNRWLFVTMTALVVFTFLGVMESDNYVRWFYPRESGTEVTVDVGETRQPSESKMDSSVAGSNSETQWQTTTVQPATPAEPLRSPSSKYTPRSRVGGISKSDGPSSQTAKNTPSSAPREWPKAEVRRPLSLPGGMAVGGPEGP